MIKGRGLTFGVIGAGSMGQNHLRIAAELSGLKLIGLFDKDPSLANDVASKYGVSSFSDCHELLAKVDAVSIVTPTKTHLTIASDVLSNNKHVLLEKPFTGRSSDAEVLSRLANEKGVVLNVGFIERFNPAFIKLQKLVKGEKIIGVDIKRFSPFPSRISDTDVIFDMMIHDLDLLNVLIPFEIEEVRAEGNKVKSRFLDRVSSTIVYKSGVIARVSGDRTAEDRTRKISVTTEKQVVEADLLNKVIYLRDFSSPIPSTTPVPPVDQLTSELTAFLGSIKGIKRPGNDALAAIRAIKLAEEVKNAC
ncbi:MAG: Gfo/Idh/MocA family oxidoreductase [Candidatus Margulisbacteria bacterium]|nr:Gfo/Idh/MocA family oxidoreductase [Candidatus Margulisiibacteriota bacterium]MBU1616702.1 Gfo/Idh/MocA family oxidoreductase [Candidatus Margulisiibacteriota bacterium]